MVNPHFSWQIASTCWILHWYLLVFRNLFLRCHSSSISIIMGGDSWGVVLGCDLSFRFFPNPQPTPCPRPSPILLAFPPSRVRRSRRISHGLTSGGRGERHLLFREWWSHEAEPSGFRISNWGRFIPYPLQKIWFWDWKLVKIYIWQKDVQKILVSYIPSSKTGDVLKSPKIKLQKRDDLKKPPDS